MFFLKQKTAYEVRISDWSSDVCSSDLLLQPQLQTCRPSCKIAIEEYIGGTRRQILWRYRTVCTIPCVGPVDHAEEQHCIDIRVTVTRRFGTDRKSVV